MNDIRPKIGISVPTSIDLAYNQRSWGAYAEAVLRAGGKPVEIDITHSADELRTLAAECAGFVLPGSPADVDPCAYDQPRIEACGPADPAREFADNLLLQHAQDAHKPVLGICYGCQSMNVFYGGTLVQDLSPLPVNHSAGAKVGVAHSVVVERDSVLGTILLADAESIAEATPSDGTLRLPVNTSHHQAVGLTGLGVRVTARCPDDGVAEAIEFTKVFHVEHSAFLLGVQWHPERSYEISAASRALFAHLVAEARQTYPTA